MSVKMLTADNCLNIDPSTEYLIPSEVEFIHNLDYLKDISSVTENTRLSLKRLFDGEVGTDVSTRLSSYVDPYMLAYSFREAEECLKSFRLILSEEAPDVVVVLHENSFWTKTLAYLCAEKDILCIAFQEGLLRHRDQETHRKQTTSAEYVRYLLVWSEESKRAYIDAGIDKEKLSVVGIPHLDSLFKIQQNKDSWEKLRLGVREGSGFGIAKPLVVFAPPILSRYEGDPVKAITEIVGWGTANYINIAICLHPLEPRENLDSVRVAIENNKHTARVFMGSITLDLIASSDLVITQHSSIGLESLALNIPTAILDFDNVGILESLADQGVALHIDKNNLSDLGNALNGLAVDVKTLHMPERSTIDEWVSKNVGPRDGMTIPRILDIIGRSLNG